MSKDCTIMFESNKINKKRQELALKTGKTISKSGASRCNQVVFIPGMNSIANVFVKLNDCFNFNFFACNLIVKLCGYHGS